MEQQKPKIGIIGFGRMGQTIAKQATEKNFKISCVFDIRNTGVEIGNFIRTKNEMKISNVDNMDKILGETEPDVVIDFSNADACIENFKVVAKKKINVVIGTTGFDKKQENELKKRAGENNIGVVISPNMSIGVNIFWKIIKNTGKMLNKYGFNVEIIEEHHDKKKDAPSGTAKKMEEILREIYDKQIPTHSIRLGTIPGTHEAIFAGYDEIIKVKHIAYSREIFANGALLAAEYIKGKKGIYDMGDVLGTKNL